MKKLGLLLIAAMVTFSLTGCNTTKGLGEDIENTGKNIQEGVQKND